ncbi:extracellular solute-binding protein [Endozoicomonadaceae bacterium StTr2]
MTSMLFFLAGLLQAQTTSLSSMPLTKLIEHASSEGLACSLTMPDTWANWKQTWDDLYRLYDIRHRDTSMNSAQAIACFNADKANASADITDIGMAFVPNALRLGVCMPYRTTTWGDIPDWARDDEGYWVIAYTGTIAFIINNHLVPDPPRSWSDIANGRYRVAIGNVGGGAQPSLAVLSAAYALGGDESNLDPALNLFTRLARQGRLNFIECNSITNLERGEVEVGLIWDFLALHYREMIGTEHFTVQIPLDGTVTEGYTTIINRYAPHPHAAALAREYILSDAGQINLARGYARPIRKSVVLPDNVREKLLPEAQYINARTIKNRQGWIKSSLQLQRQWQTRVAVSMP